MGGERRIGREGRETNFTIFLSLGNFWQKRENRVALFNRIASRLAFDPLVPENWYKRDRGELRRADKV